MIVRWDGKRENDDGDEMVDEMINILLPYLSKFIFSSFDIFLSSLSVSAILAKPILRWDMRWWDG